nr:immunoglobulin heavy chain junction region [Macaca mulatta]
CARHCSGIYCSQWDVFDFW